MEQEHYMEESKTGGQAYTCAEYREEMILLGLQRQLAAIDLTPERKEDLLKEIARVEIQMGLE
jgi:hypothetical protein